MRCSQCARWSTTDPSPRCFVPPNNWRKKIRAVTTCVVVLPGGRGSARASLAAALTAKRYGELIDQIEDPDLVDQ